MEHTLHPAVASALDHQDETEESEGEIVVPAVGSRRRAQYEDIRVNAINREEVKEEL